jgi:molybdate transport system substrate-binding protein
MRACGLTSRLRGARIVLAAVAFGMGACAADHQAVTVLAASSLQDVVPRIIAGSATLEHADLRVAYAASSSLARQLEAGAGGDIFLSASVDWVDRLVERGVLDGASRVEMIGNRLVLVASRKRAPSLTGMPLASQLATLLDSADRLAMGDPAHVPAGRYARAALERLALWERIEARCAFADNVRAALALVARGEAPLGIVYATDVALDTGVVVIGQFDADPQVPIAYSFARRQSGSRPQVTQVFEALTDAAARRVYVDAGFVAL